MSETRYSNFIRSAEESIEYWTETAITDFTEELCRRMDEEGVSRAELAQRIGHSPAYVTKVLRGNVNFTLATITKLARALGSVVRIHLAPEGVAVEWKDSVAEQTMQPIILSFQQEITAQGGDRKITTQLYSGDRSVPDVQLAMEMG